MSVPQHFLNKSSPLEQHALQEQLLFANLEQLFIERRIYHEIENCNTWPSVLETLAMHLAPYADQFYRPLVEADFVKLTEIKIKRIAKYSHQAAQETLTKLRAALEKNQYHLAHLTEFTINWYKHLLNKYGKKKPRKTQLTTFASIAQHQVVHTDRTLYVHRKQGFIGYALKAAEAIAECSELDNALVIRKDGKCLFTKIVDKVFVGNNILYLSIYRKTDIPRCYHIVYVDGATGIAFVKRFFLRSLIRDKIYDVTMGTPGSRIVYISAQADGATETITVTLSPTNRAVKKRFEFNFAHLAIKDKSTKGNILTKYAIYRVSKKKEK